MLYAIKKIIIFKIWKCESEFIYRSNLNANLRKNGLIQQLKYDNLSEI